MAVNLNNIKLESWAEDPNVSNEIGKAIEKAVWQDSVFEPLMGAGEARAFRTFKVNSTSPKAAFTPRLKAALTGSGVTGNADFETNFDKLEIHSLTIYPISYGNALKSEIELNEKMRQVDFIKEATDSLQTWIKQKLDRVIAVTLSNDFTNCVVCDGNDGYKDTSKETSVQNAARKITTDDTLNVRAIKRAIYMAKRGIGYNNKPKFPIKPVSITYKSNEGIRTRTFQYIILVDTAGAEQLKNDPEWIELQKTDKRGLDNNLFTGFLGVIDGCPVIDMGTWTEQSTGLLHSGVSDEAFKSHLNRQNLNNGQITPPSFYTNKQAVGIGLLMGASSLLFAGLPSAQVYIDRNQDLGRKMAVGIDRIAAIAKARWISHDNPDSIYHNTDYATIGIFYAHRD